MRRAFSSRSEATPETVAGRLTGQKAAAERAYESARRHAKKNAQSWSPSHRPASTVSKRSSGAPPGR